jgi:hypothetical protein
MVALLACNAGHHGLVLRKMITAHLPVAVGSGRRWELTEGAKEHRLCLTWLLRAQDGFNLWASHPRSDIVRGVGFCFMLPTNDHSCKTSKTTERMCKLACHMLPCATGYKVATPWEWSAGRLQKNEVLIGRLVGRQLTSTAVTKSDVYLRAHGYFAPFLLVKMPAATRSSRLHDMVCSADRLLIVTSSAGHDTSWEQS